MAIILFLLKHKFSYIGKILSGKPRAPKFFFFSFILVFLLVMAGEFFGFLRAFSILKNQEFFGPPLTLFVLEEFFLLVFALFILSALITGFYIFFKSADLSFLTQFPIKPKILFRLKFLETA